MRRLLFLGWAFFLGTLSGETWAVEVGETLANPALEHRARVLSRKIRCVVCSHQGIDDSNAPFAKDLRIFIRSQILRGKSDQEILDHLVARYGEQILFQPRFYLQTWILWGVPFLFLLLAAGVGGTLMFRGRQTSGA